MAIQVLSSIANKPHAYRFNETDNWVMFDPYEISKSADGKNWQSSYDVDNLRDVYCYKADIDRANPVDTLRTFAGTDGQTVDSTRYETRNITLHFVAHTIDLIDSDLVAEELQRYFASRLPYWVVIAGKYGRASMRWLVKAGQVKIIESDDKWALVDVPLVNLSGVAQSVVNSVEFETNPNLYGSYGMTLTNAVGYTNTTTSFSIFNPGDIAVDPLQQHHDLTITITGVGKPVLKNTTNNTSFSFTKALTASDKLELIKVNPYLNGTQDGIDSDHGWIQLEKGMNALTISGLTNPEIIFDFAWYYLA